MIKGNGYCSNKLLRNALILLNIVIILCIWFGYLYKDYSRDVSSISPFIPNLFQNDTTVYNKSTIISPMAIIIAKDIQITIAVISNNRLDSLIRLLKSLSNLENPSNIRINLRFSLEASSSKELVDYVYGYGWTQGHKSVMLRVLQGGLIRAVIESWFPASNNDYGLLLEDDIEVSPYAIIWIEKILLKVLNNKSFDNKAQRIIGISLYQPKVTETNENESNRRKPFYIRDIVREVGSVDDSPFLFQTPCSWGAVYFPDTWKVFLAYVKERQSAKKKVYIPYSYTNWWRGSWKQSLFEFMYIKGYFLVYPNFDEVSVHLYLYFINLITFILLGSVIFYQSHGIRCTH